MQSREDMNQYLCIMQGDLYFNSGNNNKAINEYYLAIEMDPLFSIPYFKLGLVYAHMGHDDKALICFNRAIELKPQYTESYIERANINAKRSYIKSAIHDYRIAVVLSPSAAIYYQLGMLHERIHGHSIKALQAYTHAITLDPHFYDAYARRAYLHYNECNTIDSPFNLSAAIEDYRSAVNIRPTLAEAHYHLGKAYSHEAARHIARSTRDIYQAIECFGRAVSLDPTYIDAYLMRARIYHQDLSAWQKASCDYECVLALEPDNWDAQRYLPTIKSQLAIINCTTEIKIRPSAELYLMRGHAYNQTSCYKEAEKDYSQAIKLDNNMADAYLARGDIYKNRYMIGWTEAINDYQSAYMIAPNRPEAYFKLGLIYECQDEFELALSFFDKTLELDPNHADAYKSRGYVHMKLNKKLQSLLDYIKANELMPNCYITLEYIDDILKEYPNRLGLSELIINHANLNEKLFLMSQILRVDTVLGKKFRECSDNHLCLFQIDHALRLLREPYEAMTKGKVDVRRAARCISLGQRDTVSFFRYLPDEIAVMIAARVSTLKDLNEREADEIAYDHLCTPLTRGVRYKK